MVYIPTSIEVSEDEETVQLCVTLSTREPTERDFNVILVTSNNTGKLFMFY